MDVDIDVIMADVQDDNGDNDVLMHDELGDFDFSLDDTEISAPTTTATVPRYELRPQPYTYTITTPYDNDQSGDWDPANVDNEESFLATSRVTSGGRPTNTAPGQASSSRPHHESELHARMTGRSFPIVLQVKSDIGRLMLSLHPSYWPFDDKANAFSSEHLPEQENPGYSFRKRKAVAYDYQDEESYDHLVGHPEARGCKCCYSCGAVCDLTLPGGSYPCSLCKADDHLCEPCIAPKKKDACEACRDKLVPCSYDENQTDEHHAGPCHRCQTDNVRCVAGPASVSTLARISDDGKPAAIPHRPREYTSCTGCRTNKINCSLRRKKDPSLPCIGCGSTGTVCTFEPLPRQATNKATAGQTNGPASLTFDPEHAELGNRTLLKTQKLKDEFLLTPRTYHIVPDTNATHGQRVIFQTGYGVPGVPKSVSPLPPRPPVKLPPPPTIVPRQIITQLCHPVQVDHPEPDRCNWCINPPSYARSGQGPPRVVTVLMREDGRGYIEIEGGYSSPPFEHSNSIMCENCTRTRWKWMQHRSHDMVAINYDMWGCDLCKDDTVTHMCRGGDCDLSLCGRCSAVMMEFAGGSLQAFLQAHQTITGDYRTDWERSKLVDLELLVAGGFFEKQMTLGRLEDDEVI